MLGLGLFCDVTPYSLADDLEPVASIFRVHEEYWSSIILFSFSTSHNWRVHDLLLGK
jgi:hypothetical protein